MDQGNRKSSAGKAVPRDSHACRVPTRRGENTLGSICKRGGKLKQRRLRHLAQKFLYLWIQKTFGRVHPSKARLHHRRRVLRKALDGWKEEWWVSRREWTLSVRADYHYRYHLYNRAFLSWQAYVLMQREQKKNLNKAACYADGRCLQLAWESWLMYLEMQRVKQRMQMSSQEQRKKAALRWAWTLWRDCLELKNEQRLMDEHALQHWALALQNKAWLQWRAMFLQTCSKREEEARIKLYYSHGLQRRVLHAWTSYLQHRQVRREQKVISEHAWHLLVVRRWWCRWRFVYLQRQNERDKLLVADSMAQRNIKVQALHHWMGYVNQCLQRAGRDQFAQEHYKQHLLNMGLRLLVLNVTQKKARRVDNNVALQQYQHSVIVRYWSYWKQRLEEIEEMDQQLQKEKALAHYSTTLMRSSLRWWREHLTEHKISREMELRADRWFAERTLQQCLSTWVEFVAQQQRNRERKRKASVHVRQQTYSLVFYTWLARSVEQREQRLAERMAVLHNDRSTLLRTWVHWHSRAHWEREEKEKHKAAEKLYLHTLVQRTLLVWRGNVALIRSGREREKQAMRHGHLLCVRRAFSGWREFIQHQREKTRIQGRVDCYYQHKLLIRTLDGWKRYHHRVRLANHIAEGREREHHRRLLRKVLCKWRVNAAVSMGQKIKQNRATTHYQRTLLSKVLLLWREVTVHRVYSHHQQEQTVKRAQAHLQRVKLQQTFKQWRERSREVSEERLGMEKARRNHHSVLLRSILRAWHLQHCQHQTKQAMKGQADWFQQRRICLHYFNFWKRQLILRRNDAEHTDVALWHWSVSLQAKVMEAWRGWITERRQMRDRLVHAAQFHRDQLLREGVAHILTYTADMGSFRVSLALQTQEQSTRRLQSVVRHCAMRWKQQALCKPGGCRSRHHKKSAISRLPVPDSASESTSKDISRGHALEQGPTDCTSNQWVFVRASSLQPRIPDHLLNSLDTEMAPRSTHSSTQLLLSRPICTSDRHGKGQASPIDQPLFQTTSTIQETPPVGQTGCWHEPPDQELLPPSSFMTTGATTHKSQWEVDQPNKKFNNSQPPVPTGGVCEEGNKDKVEEMGMNLMDPQPSPYSTFDLTKVLLRVRQEMHRFQQEKQQLQSWRKLAEVLRSWLQTNANLAETECLTTRLELEELEAQISRLAKQLEEEKPVMRQYATMINSISSKLRDTDL